MKFTVAIFAAVVAASVSFVSPASAQDSGAYKVVKTAKVGGAGGWDYVYADADGRRLYIPRSGRPSGRVTVFDLDTLAPVGVIDNTDGVHGVAVDPKSGHGFASSNPVVMFDTKTLTTIKTINVDGSPDGILFDPATESVFVLSHEAPNATVINAVDGSIAGTIDLGGAPEQAQSDGNGHIYVDLEDQDSVAVVDAKARKVTATYSLNGKGGGPGGLGLDAKNHLLFVFCHDPAVAVIMSTDDGKILATLPTGTGVDSGGFNPNTMEAFSSNGDGTLTIIKEDSPTTFEVEQNVKTMAGARTSTLDTKTNQIYLISAERAPASRPTSRPAGANGGRRPRGGGGRGGAMVPDSFTIVVVGK